MEWMLMPLKRYADFSGRSRRKEYWMFLLGVFIAAIVIGIVEGVLGLSGMVGGVYGPLTLILLLGIIIPGIAVQVRRFHDQDKSGWFVLLGLIPFVGGLIVLVFMCLEGTKGPNRFGETEKEIIMAKPATQSRQSARVLQLRKGATIEMVRLTCPDEAQALRIAESFATAILDSDGIRDMHERLIVETATGLSEGLSERAMQIHLQRIVGAYVGSAHGAGQFYSRAVTEARDATAKGAAEARDEDLDGPVGYDSAAQRKREFAADMGVQAHALRMAAEGAVAAYEQIVGEVWKPFDRPVDNPGQSLDRKAAAAQMSAFD